MEATRPLEIELPGELADWMRTQIESGRFESENEAVASALMLLREQDEASADPEVENWLRTEAAEAYDDWRSGKVKGLTVDKVLANLEARRAERDRVKAAE